MKKIFCLISLTFLFGGCLGLNKAAHEIDKTVVTVDVKVEDIKVLYLSQKTMYIEKKKHYIEVKKMYLDSDLKKYIDENEPKLSRELMELDSDLTLMDYKLVELDKKVTLKYITWQDYKVNSLKLTDNIRKLDVVLEGVSEVVKTKLINKI